MRLSEIKSVLAAHDLRLTKSLGQNFLHDGNQLRKILGAAELRAEDQILEIGPGLGPLTEPLLAAGARVLAIEKDRRLAALLRERFAGLPRLCVVEDDALAYLRNQPTDWRAWKLVANLPYSVASPLLVELACLPQPPERLVVTVQWEVAQRLMAAPRCKEYGTLTLLVQARYHPAAWFRIPAACFFPAPAVDSACLCLTRRATPLVEPDQQPLFQRLVKRSFSQRRKRMWKLLRAEWPAGALNDAFRQAGLSLDLRAEAVSVEQFACLTSLLGLAATESP